MKARTRKTRWLLITLLLGFLAAAGVTFVLHQHPGRLLVSANGIVPADDTSVQQTEATAPAAFGDELPARAPVSALPRGDHYIAGTYSNSAARGAGSGMADDAGPLSIPYGDVASEGTNEPTDTTVGPGSGTQPKTHGSASSSDTIPPAGSGEYAYGGAGGFGCGLPGCGGGNSERIHTSGSSGGTPSSHDSQGSDPQNDNPHPPPSNSTQTTDNSNPNDPGSGNPGTDSPGQSDPSSPGSGHSVAAAPELDPATLAGALTLLLGALAIVRSRRRVRATIR